MVIGLPEGFSMIVKDIEKIDCKINEMLKNNAIMT